MNAKKIKFSCSSAAWVFCASACHHINSGIEENNTNFTLTYYIIMQRQRSLSITPTYSTDRAILLQNKPNASAANVEEAIEALLSLNICNDSTFKRRANLESQEDWSTFLESCVDVSKNVINLESALKKCYSLAYSMPPSPIAQQRATSAIQDPTLLSI